MQERATVPRGRHAPPLEVRQTRQRGRLFAAAAAVFARVGYAEATAEAIAREAGMSKATFYEHFGNKEDCIVALFDTATEIVLDAMRDAAARDDGGRSGGPRAHHARRLPRDAREATRTSRRRCWWRSSAPARAPWSAATARSRRSPSTSWSSTSRTPGAAPRRASPRPDDAFAIVGAVVELASRQIRTGVPGDIRELEPVVERLSLGLMAAGERP